MSEWEEPCLKCKGRGMMAVEDGWQRTCKHCFGSGSAIVIMDSGTPHAIDHSAYECGVSRPETMLALEQTDLFWKTLGGSSEDPWGDQGETFRQRSQAASLGIGLNIYLQMLK